MRNTAKTNAPYIYIYIGFNDPKIHKRGVENIISLQSRALPGQRIFYVFFGSANKASKWGNICVISIKKFHFLKLNLIFRFLKKKYKSKLFIHSHNYQLSFFCWYTTNVLTVHDGITYLYKKFKRKYVFIFSLIELGVYYRAKKIHFVSNFSKGTALLKKKYDHKSVIIYNSTPLETIKNSLKIEQRPNENDLNEIKIFCVRSIEERARIDLLIEVCLKLMECSIRITVTVAGKGPLLNYYGNIIEDKKIDNLYLIGYVNDSELVDYYDKCDLVILTSEYGEGFGLPIIEGYLFGKPVIASRRCAIPEIIINNEMLFDNDADEIYKKINYFIDNKEELTRSAPYSEYYLRRFSQDQIVSLYRQKLYT